MTVTPLSWKFVGFQGVDVSNALAQACSLCKGLNVLFSLQQLIKYNKGSYKETSSRAIRRGGIRLGTLVLSRAWDVCCFYLLWCVGI